VTPRLGPTAVVGLAGAGLAAVASAQVWGRAEVTEPAVRVVEARGSDVAPVALPLALVALAAWGAVLVLRSRGRRIVAAVGLAAALGVGAVVAARAGAVGETARGLVTEGATRGDVTTDATLWPYAAGVGAVLAALAFLAALRAAPTWPEMSSRYDAPAAEGTDDDAASSPGDLWSAIDEGRDPTA
jgi:uncharacterized membrane protein (TIGR02234 family)